jgi:hypothetical protein
MTACDIFKFAAHNKFTNFNKIVLRGAEFYESIHTYTTFGRLFKAYWRDLPRGS